MNKKDIIIEIEKSLRANLVTGNEEELNKVAKNLELLLVPYKEKGCKMDYDSSYYIKEDSSEVIDKIEAVLGLGFKYYLAGNIVKYIERYEDKYDDLQEQCNDLLKAREYLKMLLEV